MGAELGRLTAAKQELCTALQVQQAEVERQDLERQRQQRVLGDLTNRANAASQEVRTNAACSSPHTKAGVPKEQSRCCLCFRRCDGLIPCLALFATAQKVSLQQQLHETVSRADAARDLMRDRTIANATLPDDGL